MTSFAFEAFPKIPRLKKEIVVTEKIDGTNAQINIVPLVDEDTLGAAKESGLALAIIPGKADGDTAMAVYAGSRTRYVTVTDDNFGFAKWVALNVEERAQLGPGRHFGEWYGQGIQRKYDLDHKRFALFNAGRWNSDPRGLPSCCEVVPVLARGEDVDTDAVMDMLNQYGSHAVPGYRNPEGIVIYHSASRQMYKRTFEHDKGKWT